MMGCDFIRSRHGPLTVNAIGIGGEQDLTSTRLVCSKRRFLDDGEVASPLDVPCMVERRVEGRLGARGGA